MTRAVEITWRGSEVLSREEALLAKRLERAGFFLVGKTKQVLSKGQPLEMVTPRGGGVPYAKGLDPAKKGEPPRLLLGALRNSVKHRVLKRGSRLILQIGAFVPYARRHELGDHPFLRPTIRKNARKARAKVFPKARRKAKR